MRRQRSSEAQSFTATHGAHPNPIMTYFSPVRLSLMQIKAAAVVPTAGCFSPPEQTSMALRKGND
jgi:hypothetical protein